MSDEQPAPPPIQMSPLPTRVMLGHQLDDAGIPRMVTLLFETPQGVSCFFLTPESAVAMAPALLEHGQACSRLELPDAELRSKLGLG